MSVRWLSKRYILNCVFVMKDEIKVILRTESKRVVLH